MTGYDEAFPLPEPEFLWIHDLTYTPATAASVIVDPANGKWRYAPSPSVQFTGYIAQADRREVARAATQGITVDAVALMSHTDGAALDPLAAEHGVVVCDGTSTASPWLHGQYTVTQVRPNPSHIRLILTRLVGEKPLHGA